MDEGKKKGNSTGEEKVDKDTGKTIETIIDMGKFYYVNKKFGEAKAQFERALTIEADNEEALLNIGLLHEVNNDSEKAKKVYQKILKINPDNCSAKEKLNKLSGL